MKRVFIFLMFGIGCILFGQNTKFNKIYSTENLLKIRKSVPEKEKREFYKQYLRAKLVEEMRDKFQYKKYSPEILQKFADTIVSYCDDTFSLMPEQNIETKKNQTIEEGFSEKKIKFENDEKQNKIVNKLNLLVINKTSDQEPLKQLLFKLLYRDLIYYPKVISKTEQGINELEIAEIVPADILAFDYDGNGGKVSRYYYKISTNKLSPISIYPNDKILEKFRKYINIAESLEFKEENILSGNKLNDESYLITGYVESTNNSTYEIEFKTKNFVNFTPLRIKKIGESEDNKWIIVK